MFHVKLFQCRSALPPGSVPAPSPGSAGVAAPVSGEDPLYGGLPSCDFPPCPLTSQWWSLLLSTNQTIYYLHPYTTGECATGALYSHTPVHNHQSTHPACERSTQWTRYPQPSQHTSNGKWHILNIYPDRNILLVIGGIERNPGPTNNHSRSLKIAHVNINSITAAGRLDELHQFVHCNDIKILALTETKLDDGIHPALYHLDNFHTPLTNHRNRHGGGTAIYAHKSLPITQLKLLELDGSEEWIWCKISFSKISLLVCCLYLPPNLDANRLEQFTEHLFESVTLANTYAATATIILGDFNSGNTYLDQTQHIPKNSGVTSFDHKLFNTAETLGLTQLIKEPTRMTDECANLRDLIFTNNIRMIDDSGTLSSFSCLDHFPVYAELRIETFKFQTLTKTLWDYDKIDSDLFIRTLQKTDWTTILNKDVHTATTDLTHAILSAAKTAIPTKVVHIKNKDKPWVNNELKRNIRKRNMLFKCAKRTQSHIDWCNWKTQRNFVSNLNKRLHSEHIQSQVTELIRNKRSPYKYHQILSDLTGRKHSNPIPPLLKPDGEAVSDNNDKAQLLNEYFASQTRLDISNTQTPQTTKASLVPYMDSFVVSESEVLSMLNSLDPNKSTGPDDIPTKLLKISAILIVEPLTKLFNKSLNQGIFSNSWKTANIKPIFKNKGSPANPTNYRPISLLSCISKMLEKIVFKNIYTHLSNNNLLSDKQSGYRPKHSTQLQLIYLTHNLYKELDSGREFTAIYLDISKYFDKIWHDGLLEKCKSDFGLTGTFLTWLQSYLTNRTHKVIIENSSSSLQTINAGCPQGSVLGPLLALMYLDGLSTMTTNDTLFFADDTSLYASHSNIDFGTTQISLQNDLDNIYRYGQDWKIIYNGSKTIRQTFSLKKTPNIPQLIFDGQVIPVNQSHKHLGISLSNDLKFKTHINDIIKKVNRALGPIYPIARYVPRTILDQMYSTYIRPYFDYCDIIYDGLITATDSLRLERLQNRVARLITGTMLRTPTNKLRLELGWTTMENRRKIHKLILYHRIQAPNSQMPLYINSILPESRISQTGKELRNSEAITQPYNRTSIFKNSFIPNTTKLWNKLARSVRQSNHISFKRTIIERFSPPPPPAFFTFGSKRGNLLHTRLRVGASQLNSHLYQFQLTDSPKCSCSNQSETAEHFILNCPLHNNYRTVMLNDLSTILDIDFTSLTKSLQMNIILNGYSLSQVSGRRVAYCVQRYIMHTQRFS